MLKSGLNSFERDCAPAYKVSAQAGGNFKVKLFPKHFVENNLLLSSLVYLDRITNQNDASALSKITI